ncbi:MAG: hypothetical protein HYY86_01865 [Candidatus Harrisonbacteria bacterium]|nr:hypothetical protein [Candidatus Harrisonbacteria bacterium]
MTGKIQNFFLKLQQEDEATRKRWLIILTSGTMAVVVSLWLVYLNFTIKALAPEPPKEEAGFFKTSANGLQIISQETALKISQLSAYLKSLANQTNSITIQPANINLILEDLETVKPKKLP